MRISVRVKPHSRENRIIKQCDDSFVISVTALPEKGKANLAVIKILSDYFKIAQNKIRIISGMAAKNKIVEMKHHGQARGIPALTVKPAGLPVVRNPAPKTIHPRVNPWSSGTWIKNTL